MPIMPIKTTCPSALVLLLALGPVLGLGACSTIKDTSRTTRVAATEVHDAVTRQDAPRTLADVGRPDDLGDALLTPASDLNMRKADMPYVLARIEDPYAFVPESCEGLAFAVAELDTALGPDYDAKDRDKGSPSKRAGLGLLASAVGDIIPFRGVVREVSGAAPRERRLREAYRQGNVRRGYLKGVAAERDCPAQPAAPVTP